MVAMAFMLDISSHIYYAGLHTEGIKKLRNILIIFTGALFALSVRASTTVFTDNTFNLGNYSETAIFKSDSSDTVSFAQCPTCGNPGQALQIHETFNSFSFEAIGFINNTFAYNPLTQGAISTIDVSVDKNIIIDVNPNPTATRGNTFRPLIEQDFIFYLATIPGPNYTGDTTNYITLSQNGLTSSDFTEFDYTTGAFVTGVHPNFAGDSILLGLSQNTTFEGGVTVDFDYDNLRFAVNTPDPGNTILLLFSSATALLVFERLLRRQLTGNG